MLGLVSLTDRTAAPPSPAVVGGKASSLAKLYRTPGLSHNVPSSFALTCDFFQPWIDAIATSDAYQDSIEGISTSETPSSDDNVERLFANLKTMCFELPLSDEQRAALGRLRKEMTTSWSQPGLAAVRSSAPEEDGTASSYAGAFETKLGVAPSELEGAVRSCLASLFDRRVFVYRRNQKVEWTAAGNDNNCGLAFAAVVMEMVDSVIAGVAFSANPLNSDRDEMTVDSSYGLGESVVDGSVSADHYIFNKVTKKVVERSIGKKTEEKRLNGTNGCVDVLAVSDESRQIQSSLTDEQLDQLACLVQIVEDTYEMPMDVEFAFTETSESELELKLLQARPITTLFFLDEEMMTKPGEQRVLYYDYNVASEATTTTPFSHLDMTVYNLLSSWMIGFRENFLGNDPRMPLFCSSTRQYANMSLFLKWLSPEWFSNKTEMLDPYLASIFASKDCNREMYRLKKVPKEINIRNSWKLLRRAGVWDHIKLVRKFKKHPEEQVQVYMDTMKEARKEIKQLEIRGLKRSEGLEAFLNELFEALFPALNLEAAFIMYAMIPLWRELDEVRRVGKTEEIRSEYDALCGGYEGDELMEMNVEMYLLAQKLGDGIWNSYQHEELEQLAARIDDNLACKGKSDLSPEFLDAWTTFMDRFGYDGQDQLFLSSPRYRDSPWLLLSKLKQNIGSSVIDPAVSQKKQVDRRRHVMQLHRKRAKKRRYLHPFKFSAVKKRNAILETFWMRNSPKLHLAEICGILRKEVLKIQDELLASGQLDEVGDIFHLDLNEIDAALMRDKPYDLESKLLLRKAMYKRATLATECPMLVDSRCRILRPDPPSLGDQPDGTLVGAAISPGVARGRVRIIHSPNEKFESGEVLAAVVTGPAWTPLFAGCAGVVLQIGGALQHGSLCAREYGKPAVSNINVNAMLKTGMLVEIDGNTGLVRILPESEQERVM